MRVLREVIRDASAIARSFHGERRPDVLEIIATMSHDGSLALCISRLRQAAGRHGLPFFGSGLRRVQTALFGIEIARNVQLGEGVVFLHTVGVVIGGDARIGDRVVFLGGNTVGSLNNRGYPRIGNDVVIGAGARILGPVTIGDGATIGANAVVLSDVPAGATAVGVPAVVRPRGSGRDAPPRRDQESAP